MRCGVLCVALCVVVSCCATSSWQTLLHRSHLDLPAPQAGFSRPLFESLLTSFNGTRQQLHFSRDARLRSLQQVRDMFRHGYDNYMRHAFPQDELNPIDCSGRGPDHADPSNLNINDVLGDYSLTLVDVLDTLVVFGNASEFDRAVRLVVQHVTFDVNSTVQLFESNIRVLGALLSAHLLLVEPDGALLETADWYDGQLLDMAHDLATRLLPAFDDTASGLPHPRLNLRSGVPVDGVRETCLSGAGSLVLEFALLSRLVGDPVFETRARRAVDVLWGLRCADTGLAGFTVDVDSGEWTSRLSGLGAGLDSFYEYLLKAYIMFGDQRDYRRFSELYDKLKIYMRKGRAQCNAGVGDHPLYVNVDRLNGNTLNTWIDSLQAAFPAVQLLAGDLEEAICHHAVFYAIWRRFGALPERFDWKHKRPTVLFYPLRPELAESTYFLYQATRNPFYLHVGREMLESLERHARVRCGYATLHSVLDGSHEDRMESFFLSETCKYLYLLFDEDNFINRHPMHYLFSTEGHIFPLRYGRYRRSWDLSPATNNTVTDTCAGIPPVRRLSPPLGLQYLHQLFNDVGVVT